MAGISLLIFSFLASRKATIADLKEKHVCGGPLYIIDRKQKSEAIVSASLSFVAWQRPTLPGAFAPSTIGAGGLNGRVRDGYVCVPSAIITRHTYVVFKNFLFFEN
jgi:hypothetical protein